jgi:hypothetical protein
MSPLPKVRVVVPGALLVEREALAWNPPVLVFENNVQVTSAVMELSITVSRANSTDPAG